MGCRWLLTQRALARSPYTWGRHPGSIRHPRRSLDDHEIISKLYNEHWTRPKPTETPRHFDRVRMGRIGDERLHAPRSSHRRHLPASGASIGGGARRVSLRETASLYDRIHEFH